MRSVLLVMLGSAALAMSAKSTAYAEPLWDAEVRLGYGIAVDGGDGMTGARTSPLTLAGIGAVAVQEDPLLYGWGGFVVETLDRNSIAATGGVELRTGGMRLRGGAAWIFAPYTLWGATGSVGTCRGVGTGTHACGDIQMTEYFAGNDLAHGRAVTQIQLVLGVMFDAP